jgi:hypothetical protein
MNTRIVLPKALNVNYMIVFSVAFFSSANDDVSRTNFLIT